MYFVFVLFAIIVLSIAIGGRLREGFASKKEGFDVATESQVAEGSSGMYRWGYRPIPEPQPYVPRPPPPPCPKCGYTYNTTYDINYTVKVGGECSSCDITKHPDIDKYVLKSSVPPCPNMADYALKSELCPCRDMSEYIRKSEIPPCYGSVDREKYMLKTDCASYSFRESDDWRDWTRGGDWYENRAGATPNPQIPQGEVLPYNAIGEIV